jgi:hypothetical protein
VESKGPGTRQKTCVLVRQVKFGRHYCHVHETSKKPTTYDTSQPRKRDSTNEAPSTVQLPQDKYLQTA